VKTLIPEVKDFKLFLGIYNQQRTAKDLYTAHRSMFQIASHVENKIGKVAKKKRV
jgi:hypothetical protein